jgi:hypothetical protein
MTINRIGRDDHLLGQARSAVQNEAAAPCSPCRPEMLAISARLRHIRAMSGFEPTDYSVVVKNRGNPPDPWRWEIYRAGRSSAIKQSSVYFHTMAMASRAGKEALKGLLEKLYA